MTNSLKVLLFLGALLVSPVVLGQQVSVDAEGEEDPAKQLYAVGVEHFENAEFQEAADAFREAYRLKPSWRVLYNVGQSEAAAKRYGLAYEAFETYLAKGGDDIPAVRKEEVLSEVGRLKKMVGSIEVTAPEGCDIFVDGVLRGVAPLLGKVPVGAGEIHTVWAEAGGEPIGTKDFKVMAGDTLVVAFFPGMADSVMPPDDAPGSKQPGTEKSSSPLLVGGWILTGVGGAMLIGGGITGGMAISLDGKLAEECPGEACLNTTDYKDRITKLETLSLMTDVMLFTGGAAVVAGVTLLIVNASRQKETQENALTVSPLLGHGFGGAAIAGRF